ncbi:hypothetical protein NEDG_00020 [Nematocida displodere]|uniref:Uncharacterized protein n=1 Tax=Nematocida displodere TaxID=1805483 RepID=A0A177EHU6_9MICR|nr:hypothetical protein NEDG_00020 [Nematocida displodere]
MNHEPITERIETLPYAGLDLEKGLVVDPMEDPMEETESDPVSTPNTTNPGPVQNKILSRILKTYERHRPGMFVKERKLELHTALFFVFVILMLITRNLFLGIIRLLVYVDIADYPAKTLFTALEAIEPCITLFFLLLMSTKLVRSRWVSSCLAVVYGLLHGAYFFIVIVALKQEIVFVNGFSLASLYFKQVILYLGYSFIFQKVAATLIVNLLEKALSMMVFLYIAILYMITTTIDVYAERTRTWIEKVFVSVVLSGSRQVNTSLSQKYSKYLGEHFDAVHNLFSGCIFSLVVSLALYRSWVNHLKRKLKRKTPMTSSEKALLMFQGSMIVFGFLSTLNICFVLVSIIVSQNEKIPNAVTSTPLFVKIYDLAHQTILT